MLIARRAPMILLALLCSSCGEPADDEPHLSTEVNLALSPTYDGATVCVEDACDVIDGDDTLVLRPGLRGATYQVHVSMDGAELLMEGSHEVDLEYLRLDREDARIDEFTLLLLRRSTTDSECTLGVTNLETEGTTAFGEYPSELSEQPCGPFATD